MRPIIRFPRPVHTAALALALAGAGACSKKKDGGTANVSPVAPNEPVAETPVAPPEPVADEPVADEPVVPQRFEEPGELARAIAGQLLEGNLKSAVELIGRTRTETPGAYGFAYLFTDGGFRIDRANPEDSIGELDGRHRFALNVLSGTDPSLREKILIDLVPNLERGWAVDALHTPERLRSLARAAGIPAPPGLEKGGPDPAEPVDGADSLMKAEAFLSSVLDQDYESAVALCDPMKVPEEKIAALCIVFEEGAYRMKQDRPLMTTGISDDSAWVIAQVESDVLRTKSDFGLEMQKVDAVWRIVGLNFSKMLAEYAAASDAGTVPYTPIVKNPKGGESLVLYFEYDDARIGPRTRKQIDIIARILRADQTKTLSISGHTDANGPEEYNDTLSARRATAVRDALATAGVPKSQIVTKALGESVPLRPNFHPDGSDNPAGRGHNRRAEVYLNF